MRLIVASAVAFVAATAGFVIDAHQTTANAACNCQRYCSSKMQGEDRDAMHGCVRSCSFYNRDHHRCPQSAPRGES